MAQETSIGRGIESLFGTLGTVFDGAQSLLGDYFEYDLLRNEVDAQKKGISNPTSATAQPSSAISAPVPGQPSSGGNNTNTILYVGLGVMALAAFSMLKG